MPLTIGLGSRLRDDGHLLWQVQRRTGNAGIVDVAWSGLVGRNRRALRQLACWASAGCARWSGVMIGVWSLRLTVYLFGRVVGHPEEGRYVNLREALGRAGGSQVLRVFSGTSAGGVVLSRCR